MLFVAVDRIIRQADLFPKGGGQKAASAHPGQQIARCSIIV